MTELPKPPSDLGRSGREMWSALVRHLDFDAHEIRLQASNLVGMVWQALRLYGRRCRMNQRTYRWA
jgi:hypothetical protein